MSFIQKIAERTKQVGSRARDIGGKAGDKARDISKKSSGLLEVTRMKHELRKMEREMENNLAGIGALYYQQQNGYEDSDQELKRLVESTRELEIEMKELEEQIDAAQPGSPKCPDCKKELPEKGSYCSYCGKRVVE